jgi:hypothetical protein
MATFVQVIEELKESMFDLQVEQDETTQAIKSLDGRMAEFVALAGRDRLEDLEDRRESKRASQKQKQEKQNNKGRKNSKKGIGGLGIGDLAQAYVQGRLGMALLSGLGALMTTPAGIAIIAAVAGSAFLYGRDKLKDYEAGVALAKDPLREKELDAIRNFAEETKKIQESDTLNPFDKTDARMILTRRLEQEVNDGTTPETVKEVQERQLRIQQIIRAGRDETGNPIFTEEEQDALLGKIGGTARGKLLEFSTGPMLESLVDENGNFDTEQYERLGDKETFLEKRGEAPLAVIDDQGQIDVMATAAQNFTLDPAKAVSAEEFMKQPAGINPQPNFYSDAIVRMMDRNYIPPAAGTLQYEELMKQNSMFQMPPISQDIIGPIVETAIKSLRTDDNLGLGFFGAPSAGLDINELRDMNLDVEKLSIEIPPNLGGQVLSILGEGLNVGGTTVINNQTTNNVSGGGGGGGATAVNTSSSSVAPSNDYHGTLDATQVIGGAPNR